MFLHVSTHFRVWLGLTLLWLGRFSRYKHYSSLRAAFPEAANITRPTPFTPNITQFLPLARSLFLLTTHPQQVESRWSAAEQAKGKKEIKEKVWGGNYFFNLRRIGCN